MAAWSPAANWPDHLLQPSVPASLSRPKAGQSSFLDALQYWQPPVGGALPLFRNPDAGPP
jgi:hypothetical protein